MIGMNHDTVPPAPAIDAVYALLGLIADPSAAKQRMDELQAKINTLTIMAAQHDAREKNIADRENAAAERAIALDVRERSAVDMKALAADADRRVDLATQAEAKLAGNEARITAELAEATRLLDAGKAAVTAREAKVKALEADLATRIAAISTKEKDYGDRILALRKVVG